MQWNDFVAAAQEVSWVTYVGTSDASNRPHVAAVSPGYTPGTIWFATNTSSIKFRNLVENPVAAFHWPVGGGAGPGELFARGAVALHTDELARHRLWTEANLPFDPAGFFGSPDNPQLAFVETKVTTASILGANFQRTVYVPEG